MPEAILLKDVDTLGEQGNVVEVSKGYLRNYLIPRKLAQPATKGAIETVRQRQAAAERAAREAVERAQENVNLLNRTVLTIPQQAGADGRLFGSVTAQDIASAIREARGLRIDKRNVHMPEPIKNVGTYMVVVDVVEGVRRRSRRWWSRRSSAPHVSRSSRPLRGGRRVARTCSALPGSGLASLDGWSGSAWAIEPGPGLLGPRPWLGTRDTRPPCRRALSIRASPAL